MIHSKNQWNFIHSSFKSFVLDSNLGRNNPILIFFIIIFFIFIIISIISIVITIINC